MLFRLREHTRGKWLDMSEGERVFSPDVVLWATHGEADRSARATELKLGTGRAVHAGHLVAAGANGEPLRLDRQSSLDLGRCRAFASASCMSGRIDPRYDREALGLVRGLFSMGVSEVLAPNYAVSLRPELEIEDLYGEVLEWVCVE
ncbi:MAG TPA: hypothetical protein VF989_04440, partial [Polyangiaceae bacterium]